MSKKSEPVRDLQISKECKDDDLTKSHQNTQKTNTNDRNLTGPHNYIVQVKTFALLQVTKLELSRRKVPRRQV